MKNNNKFDFETLFEIAMSHDSRQVQRNVDCDELMKGYMFFRLAEMCEHGEGVPQDYEEAAKYYRLGINVLGDAFLGANENLLNLYERGLIKDSKHETECRYNIAFINRHQNDDEWDAPITE